MTNWEKYYNEIKDYWIVDQNDDTKNTQLNKIKQLYKSYEHEEDLLAMHKMLFPKTKVGLVFDGTATTRPEDKIWTLEREIDKDIIGDNYENINHHLIIGDNYKGLTNLLLTHRNKINIIYIDPPYNTGGTNLGYRDKFGRNAWLNFMKERLLIARELLSTDGVIFVSIDDNEQAYLKVLMDEIFGEENFQSNLTYISNISGRQISGKLYSQTKEYILVYGRNNFNNSLTISEEKAKDYFEKIYSERNNEMLEDRKGKFYFTHELHNSNSSFNIENRRNLYYPIYISEEEQIISIHPFENSMEIYPPISSTGVQYVWRWEKNKVENESDELFVFGSKIYTKRRDTNFKIKDIILSSKLSTNSGNSDLKKLNLGKMFNSPKNVGLLKFLLEPLGKDAVILDFFAGSGTTAHAVMQLNFEDKGNRQFIGIQLDEIRNSKNYFEDGTEVKSVDQVTIERIRRVIQGTDSMGNILKNIEPLKKNNLIVHKVVESDISIGSNNNIVYNLKTGKNIQSYKALDNEKEKLDLNEIYKLT